MESCHFRGPNTLFQQPVSGLEGEVSAEVAGSRNRTEQSTMAHATENKLSHVLDFLTKTDEVPFFNELGAATRHVQRADEPVFVNIHDTFNAPQFYGAALGTSAVNGDGYLLLEKGGAADYSDSDDYYRQSVARVTLSANVTKLRTPGSMARGSHEAVFLRGFAGRKVPLSIFGTLSGTTEYFQIKPFAIWK